MFEAFGWCYAWDVLEDGVDASLDRVVGELGLDAVTVAAITGPLTQHRPRDDGSLTRFTTEAAAHFQPDASFYGSTRLRPAAARWIRTRNPMERNAEACRGRGIRFRVSVSACVSPSLAERHPEVACKDAFGHRSPTWLCPANPDVREYVAAISGDLSSRYPIATIELQDADFGASYRDPSAQSLGFDLGAIEEFLLSLCFCESCIQAANARGVDAEAAARSVRVHLGPMLAGRPARMGSPREFLAADPVLDGFAAVRRQTVASLVEAVRKQSSAPVVVRVPKDRLAAAWDAPSIAPHCDGFLLATWDEPTERLPTRIAELADAAGGRSRLQRGFAAHPPHTRDAATLVRSVHEAVAACHTSIGFHHLGLVPPDCRDWIRQAVRFARRDASSAA